MVTGHADVLILGAGLQGTGVALELARRGIPVTLLERDHLAMNRASLRNEGKIHLGLIYANDRSLDTALLQLEGAMTFRAIVERWIEPRDWLTLSTPFFYLVASDSLMSPDQLAEHYHAVETHWRRRTDEDASLDYLGTRPSWLARRLPDSEIGVRFAAPRFQGGFETAELAIDTDRLAESLRQALARSPGVRFLPSRNVRAVAEDADGFVVEGDGADGPWRVLARQVVNATWERRLALDRQIGIAPPTDLLHRLKYRVIARLPAELRGAPSVTMVLGRYGDVVVRPDGTAYLSWYPAGLRGWTHEIEPPLDWEAPCRGLVPAASADQIGAEILGAIDAWYPGIGRSQPLLVDAGAIVAIGRSDVDDASSALHDRSRVGVFSRGAYHSVDPGKLTTAPWFALQAADRVQAVAAT